MSPSAARPLYFDSSGRSLFGWLHTARDGTATAAGVVICKPFGYESICAHLGMREFARQLAAAGIPTLRFDYAGTGDSTDIPPMADQLPLWSEDVLAAVRALQSQTTVQQVYLLGFRLGGLVALLASRRGTSIAGAVLVAPVLSGRRYLRELKITQLSGASPVVQAKSDEAAASMEIAGFELGAATLETLKATEIQASELPAGLKLLVIDSETLPMSRSWTEATEATGRRDLRYTQLPGMVEFLMTAPQFAQTPQQVIDEVLGWLPHRQTSAAAGPSSAVEGVTDPVPLPSPSSCAWLSDETGHSVAESAVAIRQEPLLFGVLTTPAPQEQRRRGVILVNAGSDYHIGASGLYVTLARKWAAAGYYVLRLDLGGLGDSEAHPGKRANNVFPTTALSDIEAAIAWLREAHRVGEVVLGGLCSGAYHALQAAISGLPIQRAFMVNPETFFWSEDMDIKDMQTVELVLKPNEYRGRFFSWATWKKALTGNVDIPYIARLYARKAALSTGSVLRDLARRANIRLPNDLGQQLEGVASRGISMVFVFASGEPGLPILRLQSGVSLQRLGKRCRIHTIDGADHVFSRKRSRATLAELLSRELFSSEGENSARPSTPAADKPPRTS
jgi:dienelactone hydrolase